MYLLFDKLFGPDEFQFETTNKSIVIPKHRQPTFTYYHRIWEQTVQKLPEIKSQTDRWTDSRARCSLDKVFKKAKLVQAVDPAKMCVRAPN